MTYHSNNTSYYAIQPFDSFWKLARLFNTTVDAMIDANPGVDPYHLFVGQMICIPQFTTMTTPAFQMARSGSAHCISEKEVELKSMMRLIWEQHVEWTRMVIISLVFNLPDVDLVIARLLQNPTDNGNIIRPFYGDEIANKYRDLIKEHLVIAADLVKAAIAGNEKLVADTEKKWYANGEQITVFLNNINPYINKAAFRKMFFEHLALTKSEAVLMIKKDYEASIRTYDKIEAEALQMADTITNAIIRQFPNMFQ